MAYTLGDPFRSLRLILRINGFLVGVVLGLFLLLAPRTLLLAWGIYTGGPGWPLRLAGAGQIGLGIFFFLTANQDYLSKLTLFTTLLTNGLLALVLLTAYFQQELVNLSLIGQVLFVLIFLLYLLGAVIPLRYVRGA
ncbi:MAG: hypothetical protein KF832_04780 [Caldilineaceae bacterium]|nr:hypothetical protein [Caldilineaceae bacterium]